MVVGISLLEAILMFDETQGIQGGGSTGEAGSEAQRKLGAILRVVAKMGCKLL